MTRVILDTNVVVPALLVPAGTQAKVLLLALCGDVALYVSAPILQEYEEILRRPRFKLEPQQIAEMLDDIRRVAHSVKPTNKLSVSAHESDNRLLECAELAKADYLVTGNTRHFPKAHKTTRIVTGRQFLDISAAEQREEGK